MRKIGLVIAWVLGLVPALVLADPSTIIPNDTSTGTVINRLAKSNGAGGAVVVSATTDIPIGIVTANAGTSQYSTITISGQAPCQFSGSTTAGDYVTFNSSGQCVDGGSSPTAPNIGTVLTTGSGVGTRAVLLNNALGSSSSILVAGGGAAISIPLLWAPLIHPDGGGYNTGHSLSFVDQNTLSPVDFYIIQSTDPSMITYETPTGTPTTSEQPGMYWKIGGTTYSITYTIQSSDTTNALVATGLAGCIPLTGSPGVHCTISPSANINTVLRTLTPASQIAASPPGANSSNQVAFDVPYDGTGATTCPTAISTVHTTITITGCSALDNDPYIALNRYISGRTPVGGVANGGLGTADQLGCHYWGSQASSSSTGPDTTYGAICAFINAQDNSNPQGRLQISGATSSSGKAPQTWLNIGPGGIYAGSNTDPGSGYAAFYGYLAAGAPGSGFTFYDRTNNGHSGTIYRNSNVNYFYDSVATASLLGYNSTCVMFGLNPLCAGGIQFEFHAATNVDQACYNNSGTFTCATANDSFSTYEPYAQTASTWTLADSATSWLTTDGSGHISILNQATSGTIADAVCVTSTGKIVLDSSATVCGLSDERLKQNIKPFVPASPFKTACEEQSRLIPINYEWKPEPPPAPVMVKTADGTEMQMKTIPAATKRVLIGWKSGSPVKYYKDKDGRVYITGPAVREPIYKTIKIPEHQEPIEAVKFVEKSATLTDYSRAANDPGVHAGFGAWAVAYVDERLTVRDKQGNPRGWSKDAMAALLGACEQEQEKIIANQENRISELEKKLH